MRFSGNTCVVLSLRSRRCAFVANLFFAAILLLPAGAVHAGLQRQKWKKMEKILAKTN